MPVAEIPLKGEHNIENVLAAVCAARLANMQAEVIAPGGRVSSMLWSIGWNLSRPFSGVEYYNDSKATNVDSTIKAIASFPGDIHLILGGKDKNSDYTPAAMRCCSERVKRVYTIGSAAEKIEGQIAGAVTGDSRGYT